MAHLVSKGDVCNGGCVDVEVPVGSTEHPLPRDGEADEREVAHSARSARWTVTLKDAVRLARAREGDVPEDDITDSSVCAAAPGIGFDRYAEGLLHVALDYNVLEQVA